MFGIFIEINVIFYPELCSFFFLLIHERLCQQGVEAEKLLNYYATGYIGGFLDQRSSIHVLSISLT